MDTMQVSDSVPVRGAVKDYLSGQIGRRSFLLRLTAVGFTATAAEHYFELVAAPAGALQSGEPDQADTLIRGAYVITMDDERRVYTDGYLAIRDGKIVGVGRDSECTFRGGQTIDGSDMVVMPGLINAHNHLVQVAGRGRGDDPPRPGVRSSPGRDDMKARMRNLVGGQVVEGVHWDEDRSYNMVRLHLLGPAQGRHHRHPRSALHQREPAIHRRRATRHRRLGDAGLRGSRHRQSS